MNVIVVTSVELGWDCVVGVYTDIKVAKENHKGEEYTFSTKTLNETKYKKKESNINLNEFKTKEVNSNECLEDNVLLVDCCNIFKDKNNLGNNKEVMLEIIKLHLEFTNNKFEYYLLIDEDGDCFIYLNVNYDEWEDDSIEFDEFMKKRGYEIR